jgi:hypothetical protein
MDKIGTAENGQPVSFEKAMAKQEEARFSKQTGRRGEEEAGRTSAAPSLPVSQSPRLVSVRALNGKGELVTESRPANEATLKELRKSSATYKLILDCLTGRR